MEDLKMAEDDRYIETLRLIVDQKYNNKDQDIEKQLDINKRRSEYDIMDREEIIYTDEKGKEFVQ